MSEDDDALDDLTEEDGLWFDYTFVEFLKTNYSKLSRLIFCFVDLSYLICTLLVSVQRAILLEPTATDMGRKELLSPGKISRLIPCMLNLPGGSMELSEGPSELILELRGMLATQAKEIQDLHAQLETVGNEREAEVKLSFGGIPMISVGADALMDTQQANVNSQISDQADEIASEMTRQAAKMVAFEHELARIHSERDEMEKEQEDLLVLLEELSSKRKVDKLRMRQAGLEVSDDEDDDE